MLSVGALKNVNQGVGPGTRLKITLPPLTRRRYPTPGEFNILTTLLADPKYDELTRDLNRIYGSIDIATINIKGQVMKRELHVNELKEGCLAVIFSPTTKNFYRVALLEDFDPQLGTIYYQLIDTGDRDTAYLENLFPVIEKDAFIAQTSRCQKITLANLEPFASNTLLRKYLEESFESAGELSIGRPPSAFDDEDDNTWLLYGSNNPESINQIVLEKICQAPNPIQYIPAGHFTFDTYMTHAKPNKLVCIMWDKDPLYNFLTNLIGRHKGAVNEAIAAGSGLTLESLDGNAVYMAHYGTDGEIYRAKVNTSPRGEFILEKKFKEKVEVVYIDYGNSSFVHPSKLVLASDFDPIFDKARPLCYEMKYHRIPGRKFDADVWNKKYANGLFSFVKLREECLVPGSEKPALIRMLNIGNGDVSMFDDLKMLKQCLDVAPVSDEDSDSSISSSSISNS